MKTNNDLPQPINLLLFWTDYSARLITSPRWRHAVTNKSVVPRHIRPWPLFQYVKQRAVSNNYRCCLPFYKTHLCFCLFFNLIFPYPFWKMFLFIWLSWVFVSFPYPPFSLRIVSTVSSSLKCFASEFQPLIVELNRQFDNITETLVIH